MSPMAACLLRLIQANFDTIYKAVLPDISIVVSYFNCFKLELGYVVSLSNSFKQKH